MHPLRLFLIASASIAAVAAALPAAAQPAQPSAGDAPPPPRLEKLEEGEAPAVTIRPPSSKSTVTEKRAPGGKRTEVKVTTGKSTYRVQSSDQPGTAQPGDGQSIAAKPAQWQVMTFDLNREKQAKQEAAEPVAPPSAAAKTTATPPPPPKK